MISFVCRGKGGDEILGEDGVIFNKYMCISL